MDGGETDGVSMVGVVDETGDEFGIGDDVDDMLLV